MSDASGFGKFVPGFEFLQNLAGQAAGGAVLAEQQLGGKARRPREMAAKDAQRQPRAPWPGRAG